MLFHTLYDDHVNLIALVNSAIILLEIYFYVTNLPLDICIHYIKSNVIGPYKVEIDLMQPIDPEKSPKV